MSPRGEIDAYYAPSLRDTFSEVIEQEAGILLVVDLTEVTFLDSSALGTLVGALHRVTDSGGAMRVVLPASSARRIFEITRLDRALDVRATRADALADD